MRVVSVLPSATEIVWALGHGSELVGRSAECDFPPEARSLPVVMKPRTLDAERPSGEIDRRVVEARGRGESLYSLDVPLLRSLRPELLLTQDLCGVCSVTEREVADACAAAGVRPRVVSLSPHRLDEVWASVAEVGRAVGDPAAGDRLAGSLRHRASPRGAGPGHRVAIVEWLDPPILAGLWTPEIVTAAGGLPLGPGPGEVGQRTSWAEIAGLRPDLLVLSPCSFSVERSVRELREPRLGRAIGTVRPPLGTFVADEAYFSRPGPRLADGIDLVRNLLRGETSPAPMPVARWSAIAPGVSA